MLEKINGVRVCAEKQKVTLISMQYWDLCPPKLTQTHSSFLQVTLEVYNNRLEHMLPCTTCQSSSVRCPSCSNGPPCSRCYMGGGSFTGRESSLQCVVLLRVLLWFDFKSLRDDTSSCFYFSPGSATEVFHSAAQELYLIPSHRQAGGDLLVLPRLMFTAFKRLGGILGERWFIFEQVCQC